MPKQIKTTVYTFAELLETKNQSAIDKAQQWLADAATDGDWYDCVYEDWKTALAQVGFEDADLAFSGFWSQGDGASFTAKGNVAKLIAFLTTPIEPKDCIDGDAEGNENFLPWLVNKIGSHYNPKFKRLARIAHFIDLKVWRCSHHYSHYNTCDTEAELNDTRHVPHVDKLIAEFREAVEEVREALSKALYTALEDEYEGITSEESLADFAEANEYTFTASGKRFG